MYKDNPDCQIRIITNIGRIIKQKQGWKCKDSCRFAIYNQTHLWAMTNPVWYGNSEVPEHNLLLETVWNSTILLSKLSSNSLT